MANYYSKSRTSYFKVTDEEAYQKLFDRLCVDSCEGNGLEDFTRSDAGNILHAFGAYGSIDAYDVPRREIAEDEDVCEHCGFIEGWMRDLQQILTEDSAFMLTEIGNEKLCYLTAGTYLVTRNVFKYFDPQTMALEMAGAEGITTVKTAY